MADDEKLSLTGSSLLQTLAQKLTRRQRPAAELFRVVEVTRDSRGRLARQGQIWHSDLNHVRRFGRAVAANSVSQGVLIADSAGAVVERIPVQPLGAPGAGWGQPWRDLPLPPAPPRQAPRALPKPAAAKATPAPAPVPDAPLADLPLAIDALFDPEATATLTPAPPPEGDAGPMLALP
jgi:hypothetical protein